MCGRLFNVSPASAWHLQSAHNLHTQSAQQTEEPVRVSKEQIYLCTKESTPEDTVVTDTPATNCIFNRSASSCRTLTRTVDGTGPVPLTVRVNAIAGLQGLGAPSPTPSVGGGPAEECEQSSNGQGTIPWITT